MNPGPRRARVSALAKVNLGLKILNKRPDGFHELRTVFQTISLADRLDIEFTPGLATAIEIDGNLDIPDNIAVRAARSALDAMRITGRVSIRLFKRIPMGAGLGGGSSDAAAVLLALPALAGGRIDLATLIELGSGLGSDVPFFLLGGRAVAVGRGTELYPLPDLNLGPGLLVAPPVHVSTAEAYRALARELTTVLSPNMISSFQCGVWKQAGECAKASARTLENDFEAVVFEQYPQLGLLKRQLVTLGATAASLSGSGSALFGLFPTRTEVKRALQQFQDEKVYPISFVSRRRYRSMWWRRLEPHILETAWPPQSRHS